MSHKACLGVSGGLSPHGNFVSEDFDCQLQIGHFLTQIFSSYKGFIGVTLIYITEVVLLLPPKLSITDLIFIYTDVLEFFDSWGECLIE